MIQMIKTKRNGKWVSHTFNSISEAYHYYLRHYSTIGDWLYYLRCAHTRLDKVSDERVMEAVFRNVFKNVNIS